MIKAFSVEKRYGSKRLCQRSNDTGRVGVGAALARRPALIADEKAKDASLFELLGVSAQVVAVSHGR
jgi:hypothetical protein